MLVQCSVQVGSTVLYVSLRCNIVCLVGTIISVAVSLIDQPLNGKSCWRLKARRTSRQRGNSALIKETVALEDYRDKPWTTARKAWPQAYQKVQHCKCPWQDRILHAHYKGDSYKEASNNKSSDDDDAEWTRAGSWLIKAILVLWLPSYLPILIGSHLRKF